MARKNMLQLMALNILYRHRSPVFAAKDKPLVILGYGKGLNHSNLAI